MTIQTWFPNSVRNKSLSLTRVVSRGASTVRAIVMWRIWKGWDDRSGWLILTKGKRPWTQRKLFTLVTAHTFCASRRDASFSGRCQTNKMIIFARFKTMGKKQILIRAIEIQNSHLRPP